MSNDNNSSNAADRFEVTTIGGVTRASMIPSNLTIGGGHALSLPGAGASSDGVHRGVIRHDGLTGEVTQHGVTSAGSSGLVDRSSVLGTFMTPFGTPTSNHSMNGTVAVNPSDPNSPRTNMATALRMGIIKQGPGGTFVDAWDTTPTGEQVAEKVLGPKVEETITQELFPAAVQAAFDERIAPLHQGTYDSAIARGTVHIADGMDSESIIAAMGDRLARDAGGTRAEHRETARMAVEAFSAQAASAVATAGVPVAAQAAMFDWFRSIPGGKAELQQALTQLTAARSTAAFTSMAQKFLAKASPPISRLKAEGFKVRGNGEAAEYQDADDGSWHLVSSMRYQATK